MDMYYLALLYWREDPVMADPETAEFAEDVARYAAFDEVAGAAIVGGAALYPAGEAVSVRHGATDPIVTDGPFVEAAEVIGGIMVLDRDNLDEALELAAQIPAAGDAGGAVELWPMVDYRQDEGAQADWWLALLFEPRDMTLDPGSAEWQRGVEEHVVFGEKHGPVIRGGGALHPAVAATTVRVRDGQMVVTDGPFAESAEVVNGLYYLAAADRDGAVTLAAQIPVGDKGGIELRRVVDMGG